MASFGMGFVHAMLIDISDGSDRGSTWDRERRLADSLVETTTRLDGSSSRRPTKQLRLRPLSRPRPADLAPP